MARNLLIYRQQINLKTRNNEKGISLLAVVLGLGTSVVFAEGVKDAKKEQTVKKSPDFIEIYMNDVPETIMDTLACEGAMIKQAFLSYGADGSRIYKVIILTSSLEETTRYFSEDGKVIR